MQKQEIVWLVQNIQVNFLHGSQMVHYLVDKFTLKQKNLKKIIDKMNLQKYLLMSFFGGTTINIGLWDLRTKASVNMAFTIEHTMAGKSIKTLLKDGKKDRQACH